MSPTRKLRRSVSATERGLWLVGGLGFGAAAAWSLSGAAPSGVLDKALSLAGLGALAPPLRLLGLLATPKNAALRRGLGESCASILATAGRDAMAAAMAYAGGVALGAAGAVGVLGGGGLTLWLAAAVVVGGVVGSYFAGVFTMMLALRQIAGGAGGPWEQRAGGGAFGPAATAPLLYAPAVGFSGGLVVPALGVAVCNARMVDGVVPEGAAIGLLAAVVIAPIIAGVLAGQSAAALDARRAVLIIEQAHQLAFSRSEHLGETPAFLHATSPAADVRLLATAWHRRFPASAAATFGLSVVAALLLGEAAPGWIVAIVAAAVVLYSAGRATDLHTAEPDVRGAARFVGSADPLGAERHLAFGLAIPALALIALGWASGAWLWCLGGAAVAGVVVRSLELPRVALLGRAALLAAIIAAAAAPGASS